ncbi:long-chain fatty acid--CoA ligase [Amycolatopsis dongchuanensis]|uniref:Long-chain fatty acid--CoA ligase n=1 Tax=Amycolatopsis dongchuanensis TaxID=1070866 RepID=A0ABP9QQB2_9PSEU
MNIAAKVWRQAELRGSKVAVRSARLDLSYADLRERSSRLAGAVRSAGLEPADRVVLICPTVPEFPVAYYGLAAAGTTVITMNTMSTVPEIEYVLADSGASLVLAWHENAGAARSAAGAAGVPFRELGDGARSDAAPLAEVHEFAQDDTQVILYTSGTTGRPKGAELTARNLDTAATMLLDGFDFRVEDRFATALPLFHVFGQAAVLNSALANGASISLLAPFDAAALLDVIRRDAITLVSGVPTMWTALLQAAREGAPSDFGTLRYATSGGAALPLEVLREFEERFGCQILEGYGLTETCAIATTNDARTTRKPGTVGRPAPGVSIEIRDEANRPARPGTVGEVHVSGPTVMKGYWNRPEATAETKTGGWLRTGDLGVLDDDGYLTIVDRIKDLIIRGGYNVYPREVEEVLITHPDVVEVAVLGVPDSYYGEEVAAVLALRPGSAVPARELKAWAKDRLAAYKVPRLYHFVDALPKGSTGKILKRGLDRSALLNVAVRG